MRSPAFLNVDLEIESRFPLRSLARELGERVMILFSDRIEGRHCLYIEIAGGAKGLDRTITSLCSLIEGLSPKGRRAWDAASRKEFDVGYEMRLSSQPANRFKFRLSTLRRMTSLGASLAVTLYGEKEPEPAGINILKTHD